MLCIFGLKKTLVHSIPEENWQEQRKERYEADKNYILGCAKKFVITKTTISNKDYHFKLAPN